MTSPDTAALDAVAPTDVATYLAGSGWTQQQRERHMSLWTTPDGGVEVLLPLDRDFRDYRARLLDAIRTIGLVEERDTGDILADIAATSVDTQHFRLLPKAPSGTIALMDAIDAARGVRDMMYAASFAAAVDGPTLVQPKTRPRQVNAFVRSVRLAAPAAGSFVLTSQVPVHDGVEVMSFNRRAVRKLHQATGAAHAAAVQAARVDSMDPFVERAAQGISANLCDAIALVGKDQPFDLRFAWARSAPAKVDVASFSFDERLIRVIQDAGRELPRLAAEVEVVFTGRVVGLDRSQGDGQATLRGRTERQSGSTPDMRVVATLRPAHYDRAVVAHRGGLRIRVTGVLRGSELVRVAGLEFVDPP